MVYKRDRLDILLDILDVLKAPARKTQILYKANINYHQLIKYLEFLKSMDLVKYEAGSYVITGKGMIFMDLFRQYKQYQLALSA